MQKTKVDSPFKKKSTPAISIAEFYQRIDLLTDLQKYGIAGCPRDLKHQMVNEGVYEILLLLALNGTLRTILAEKKKGDIYRFTLTGLQQQKAIMARGIEVRSRDVVLAKSGSITFINSQVQLISKIVLERVENHLGAMEIYAAHVYKDIHRDQIITKPELMSTQMA